MKEPKNPKKSMLFYYGIVILVVFLINALLVPSINNQRVMEVDYGTFMQMTYGEQVGLVDIQYNQIVFTNKDNTQVFRTGVVEDPNLVDRLYQHGAKVSSEIQEETSPC